MRPLAAGETARFSAELDGHHWLGHRLTGQVLRYVAELDGQWVAVAGFGSAALSCAARDQFIGWSREQQYARLIHVANNQRFCVLPAGRLPNLASAVLARLLRRLSGDYLAVYGHRVLAVETFTDPARHDGACYKAANFQLAGQTLGFARSSGTYRRTGASRSTSPRSTSRIRAVAVNVLVVEPIWKRVPASTGSGFARLVTPWNA